jgi:hypothetical protein
MANTSRYSRRPIRVRVGAPHGGGGTGSRRRGELARAEEKSREKGHGMFLTTPGNYDGGSRSKIGGAGVESRQRRGGSAAVHPRLERWHGDAGVRGELGGAEVAEGGRKEVAVAKKELGRPRRAGHPWNGCRASRGFVAARPNRGSGGLLEGSRHGAEPACWLGPDAARGEDPGCRGAAGAEQASGPESSARRKEKELTGGPGASTGDLERRAGELGLGTGGPSKKWRRRWAAATCGRRNGFAGRLSTGEMEVGRAS